ncbi:hypothetical protein LPJ75_004357 [Coemansia sp. RSA 2598]|nr:hypothetical protein LPJ75_004357 [Coemansia sp. RSA 2598]
MPQTQSQYQPRLESRAKEPHILSGLLRNRSSCAATCQTMGRRGDSRYCAGQKDAWIDDGSKNCIRDDPLDNADAETINRSNSLASDGAQSSRSINSGSTLVGSSDNGASLDLDRERPPGSAQAAEAAGAVAEAATGRRGPQPVGSTHQRSLFRRCLGTRRRPNPPVLVFVLRQHPRFAGVLEVVDCDDMTVAYRKIARETQRPWRETFHEVADQLDRSTSATASAAVSASFSLRSDSMRAGQTGIGRYAASSGPLSFAASTSTSSVGSTREWEEGSQPPSQAAAWRQTLRRHPHAFDVFQLWEISSPNPSVFPMHCRDARGVIDPVPLASMVLDRHQFCFRFQLCGNRMRWQMASKDECGRRMQLQCFVRSTIVALLFFTATPQQPDDARANGPTSARHAAGSLQRQLLWNKSSKRICTPTVSAASTDSTRRPTLPSVVILPTAFGKMPDVDAAVVESFVLFTGIEVLERFIAAG